MTSVARILKQISTLSATQRVALNRALSESSASTSGLVATAVKKVRASKNLGSTPCPHCESPLVKKSGNFHGRTRYKCGICAKTFTQLTKTPISKTRFPEKWSEFVGCCIEGLPSEK